MAWLDNLRLVTGALILTLTAHSAYAQSAAEAAAEIKAWREQCDDPDVDVRQAHISRALKTASAIVKRICVRQALESDNADIRNLGLRAAISMLPRLTFAVAEPEVLIRGKAEAARDARKMRDYQGWYATRDFLVIGSGLVFEIDSAELEGGASRWYPLVDLSSRNDRYVGQAVVVGNQLNWIGSANMPSNQVTCQLNAALGTGATLRGVFKCGRSEPFAVSAKLL
jgi:hypothetical protein